MVLHCRLLRSLLFDASWKFGDEEVLDRAYNLFQAFIVNMTRYLILEIVHFYTCFTVQLAMSPEVSVVKSYHVFCVRVDPNLKDVVYGAGVAKGSVLEWDQLWKIYNTTTDPQEQSIILRALAQSKEPWILNRSVHCALKRMPFYLQWFNTPFEK